MRNSFQSRTARRAPTTTRRAGFTLVEIMVAITIFSIGLMGMGALMGSSAKRSSLVVAQAEMTAAAEAKMEELRSYGMTSKTDPLRAKLALGGSADTPTVGYADSTMSLSGRWYQRSWQVSTGVAGTPRVTLRVRPISVVRYKTLSRKYTSLVALL